MKLKTILRKKQNALRWNRGSDKQRARRRAKNRLARYHRKINRQRGAVDVESAIVQTCVLVITICMIIIGSILLEALVAVV